MNSHIIRYFSKILKLTVVLFTIVSSINRVFGQTVIIDNNTSGVTSKYTFEYTLTRPIDGIAFYWTIPTGYISLIDPGTETQDKAYLELYVNNQLQPANTWSIGSIWSGGVQINLSTSLSTGSNIKVVVKDGIITNPSNGAYTLEWKASDVSGTDSSADWFSKQITIGGTITVVNSGGASLNSGWTFSNGVISASRNVNINASDIQNYLASGNLTLDAYQITIDESITSIGAGKSLTLKSRGDISLAASKTITTAGGDVIFWSDSDASNNGAISLLAAAAVQTAGGRIVLAGGADNGTNGGTASDGIPDGYARGSGLPGIATTGSFTINSGGGAILLRGSSASKDGILLSATGSGTVNSGGGKIDLIGLVDEGGLVANYSQTGIRTSASGTVTIDAGTGLVTIDGNAPRYGLGFGVTDAGGSETTTQTIIRSANTTSGAITLSGT